MARVKPPIPPPAIRTLGLRGEELVALATGAIGSGVGIVLLFGLCVSKDEEEDELNGGEKRNVVFEK